MPVSLAPAYFVLTSLDVQEAGPVAELLIWGAGVLLLAFWVLRNIRSRTRLYKVWDTVSCIEKDLEIPAYSKVHDYMRESKALRDFTLKFIFAGLAGVFYVVVFCYVLCRWSQC